MKKVLIKLVSILPVLTLIILLFSCSGSDIASTTRDNTAPKSKEKVVLRFMGSWGGKNAVSETLDCVFNEFIEENPDIKIENCSVFGDDFLPKLKYDFALGNDPDVFGLWPGSDIKTLVSSGRVADLTNLLENDKEWKSSFNEDMWRFTTYNGRIYGLPFEIIYEGLFVNTDLFEKYNVKIPKTYNDLKKAIIVFRKNGIIPIAYNSLAEGTFLYQNIITRLGQKKDIENPIKNGKFNDCYLKGMNYVKELYRLGAFPEDAFLIDDNQRNELFIKKKAAMIVQGSWFINKLEGIDSTVDIVPFPSFNTKDASSYSLVYGLGGGTFYISNAAWKNEKKHDSVIKLAKRLTSIEAACMFSSKGRMLTNIKINEEDKKYSKLMLKGIDLLKTSNVLIGPPDHFIDRSVWSEIIVKQFPYILVGEKKSEDVLKEAADAIIKARADK